MLFEIFGIDKDIVYISYTILIQKVEKDFVNVTLEGCKVVAEIERKHVVFVDAKIYLENREVHRVRVHLYSVERLPYVDFYKDNDFLESG